MGIIYDSAKRDKTFSERGLDFELAAEVFAGLTLTQQDLRSDYGEQRFTTAGWLHGRIVVLVWTPRGADRRIISMRKANDRETKRLTPHLG
ncbi:BrnT family toxin [Burkholderia sp. S171]|uniref:BrnT family toxin n=1 Tax=Burkholderia sp. S171 TaxID=1641860 RepID=UPI00131BFCEF|nr:BrnT family toxin [Burkholderia sp. S171]